MTAETVKYTRDEVETLEVAPGAERENLEGWVPQLIGDQGMSEAMEKAFAYRGDVTLTLKSGERFEAFVFNRHQGVTLADSWAQYYLPDAPEKRKVSYAQIARVEFSGKDYARGKHWEDWVKNYNEKKAAGEKYIAIEPEALE